jgi:acetyl-CoA carboxylase carboxyltransferase component
VHWASGVIDILVKDEAEAIAAAQKYLSYFSSPQSSGEGSFCARSFLKTRAAHITCAVSYRRWQTAEAFSS